MATTVSNPKPFALPGAPGFDPTQDLKVDAAQNPAPRSTLGELPGLAANVSGPADFPLTILILPFDPNALAGIDSATLRVFAWGAEAGSFTPGCDSRVNLGSWVGWAQIRKPR